MARKAGTPARPDLQEEALLWNEGSAFVFGVDEAGRGCLAGPVCAGVSCWAPFSPHPSLPVDIRDSKLMSEKQREAAFGPVQRLSLVYGVGFASAQEIDRWNILRATYLAVARALESALRALAERRLLQRENLAGLAFLSDGNQPLVSRARFFSSLPEYRDELGWVEAALDARPREICVVKGDSRVFSIAAASVLAKVSRDRLMLALDRDFPAYEFSLHKGYSTPRHIERLKENGPCSEHRHSFSPVAEANALFPEG